MHLDPAMPAIAAAVLGILPLGIAPLWPAS